MIDSDPSVGVMILTKNGAHHLRVLLPLLLDSSIRPKIVVIDSDSQDETREVARAFGIEVFWIPRSTFQHGKTRERGRQLLATPVIVSISQDAYPLSRYDLEYLVQPIIHKEAALAYGKQIPSLNGSFLSKIARPFNYPENGHVRGISDIDLYGSYTCFFSNAWSAYSNEALRKIGGIPPVSFGEDTVAAACLLKRGEKIAYVDNAVVIHDHPDSLIREWYRHFQIGKIKGKHQELFSVFGSDISRGKAFIKKLFSAAWRTKPFAIPYLCLLVGIKGLGYHLGKWVGSLSK